MVSNVDVGYTDVCAGSARRLVLLLSTYERNLWR
jgi:hypothetical protein